MSSGGAERLVRSTGFKLTAWYLGIFAINLAAVAGIAEYFIRRAVTSSAETVVAAHLEEYRAQLEAGGLSSLHRAPSSAASPQGREIVVVLSGGRAIYESEPAAAAAVSGAPGWRVAVATLSSDLELRVGISEAPERDLLRRLRDAVLTALGAALVLGVLGGAILTRRALRPVQQLTGVTQTVLRSGRLDARVPTRGTGDELDELATLFNRMLAGNEALVTGMRQALDSVAHDVRTPLTRIRAAAELGLKAPEDAAALREALADCVEESDRLLSMLRTLMDISAAETGVMRLDRGSVQLDALAREVLDTYDMIAEERGVRLVTGLEPVRVVGDAARLRQLVANLVDNAIKYTPSGGLVEVLTRAAGEQAQIEVRDSGIGIAAEDLPRIFERLYRGDRSRSQPGLGLGLSFVKAICEAHDGTIAVESSPGGGSTFTVHLPMEGPRAARELA
jgi:signal transduction histidine kinase